MSEKPLVIIVSGPSGVGKGTITNKVMEVDPRLVKAKSYTSRLPRSPKDESYLFVSGEEFRQEKDDQIESVTFSGYRYALSRNSILSIIASGAIPIVECTVSGYQSLLQDPIAEQVDFCSIYLTIDPEVIYSRLIKRATEPQSVILQRMRESADDMEIAARLYGHIIENVQDEEEQVSQKVLNCIYKKEPTGNDNREKLIKRTVLQKRFCDEMENAK